MRGYYKLRQARYYKLRQVLLQIATGITNCDNHYYKLRQALQIATLLQITTVQWACNMYVVSHSTQQQ